MAGLPSTIHRERLIESGADLLQLEMADGDSLEVHQEQIGGGETETLAKIPCSR